MFLRGNACALLMHLLSDFIWSPLYGPCSPCEQMTGTGHPTCTTDIAEFCPTDAPASSSAFSSRCSILLCIRNVAATQLQFYHPRAIVAALPSLCISSSDEVLQETIFGAFSVMLGSPAQDASCSCAARTCGNMLSTALEGMNVEHVGT